MNLTLYTIVLDADLSKLDNFKDKLTFTAFDKNPEASVKVCLMLSISLEYNTNTYNEDIVDS